MGVVAAGAAAVFWAVVGTTTAVVATTTGIALSLGAATVVAAGGLAIIGAAFSAVVDWAMPDLPEINTETGARLNKALNPEEPRKMIFGETAASSDIRYWEAYGTDNKQYDEVIAVATHEIESFGNFYFETDLLTFDGSGDNLQQYGSNLNKKNRTVGVTGTSLSAGAGSKWTTSSSMTGCAFYVLRFIYDQEVFPKGFPTRVTQVVKGAKVYDPRFDSTQGGAGPHRTADQATWEYNSTVYQFITNAEANGPWDSSDIGKDIEVAASTKTGTITSVSGTGPNYTIQYVLSGITKTQFAASDVVRRVDIPAQTMTLTGSSPTTISSTDIGKNPALQILWYLLGWKINSILVAGMGVNPDDIDFTSFITAANSCDTESYEGHCALSTGDSHERNLSLLRSSCGGTLIDTGGRYSFHPSIDDTGVIAASFDENDIVDSFNWVPKAKMRSQFNEIAGSFVNPSVLYQTAPYPKVDDAVYVAADGFSKRRTVDFQTIQNSAQAQKLARILLNRTRFQGVFQASFNYKAMLVKNWDIVQLSFSPLGWTNELFRVVQQSITTEGQILLTLRQESSLIYAGGTINPALPSNAGSDWDASAKIDVTGLAATAITETGASGTISDGIKVTWNAPSSIVLFTEVQYKINADSDWIAAAVLTQGEADTKIAPAESGTLYDTRARHISITNVVGDFFTDTVTTGTDRDTAPGATVGADYPTNVANLPDDGGAGTVEDPTFKQQTLLSTTGGEFWSGTASQVFFDTITNHGAPVDPSRLYAVEFNVNGSALEANLLRDGVTRKIPAKAGDTIRVNATVAHDGNLASALDANGIRLQVIEYDKNDVVGSTGETIVNGGDVASNTWLDSLLGYTIQDTDTDRVEIKLAVDVASASGGKWWCNYYQSYFNVEGRLLTEPNSTQLDGSSVDNVTFVMNNSNSVDQGSSVLRKLTRGMLSASLRDGDVVTYTDSFNSLPEILYVPTGLSYNPIDLSDTVDHVMNFTASGASVSGFTASLKIQELSGVVTNHTDTPWSAGGTFDQERTKSQTAEAWDDTYIFQFDVTVNGNGSSGEPEFDSGNVDFYTNNGGGWVFYDRDTFDNFNEGPNKTFSNQVKSVIVDGLGAGSTFGMDYVSTSGGSVSGDNVKYGTAAAPTIVTATKSGVPNVKTLILENTDTGISVS